MTTWKNWVWGYAWLAAVFGLVAAPMGFLQSASGFDMLLFGLFVVSIVIFIMANSRMGDEVRWYIAGDWDSLARFRDAREQIEKEPNDRLFRCAKCQFVTSEAAPSVTNKEYWCDDIKMCAMRQKAAKDAQAREERLANAGQEGNKEE